MVYDKEYHKMRHRILRGCSNPQKLQEAEDYMEARRLKLEELRKRLDEVGASKIIKIGRKVHDRRSNIVIKARRWIREQLGNKCEKCGVNIECILDIHSENGHGKHTYGKGSQERENDFIEWYKNKKIPEGVKLLCANCHRIRHFEIGEIFINNYGLLKLGDKRVSR